MSAKERAKPLFVSAYWNGANFQATVDVIETAETEAWNAAVEACAEWWQTRMAETQRNDDILHEMREALKRGQS